MVPSQVPTPSKRQVLQLLLWRKRQRLGAQRETVTSTGHSEIRPLRRASELGWCWGGEVFRAVIKQLHE